jgi:hypothetical protein
MRHVRLARLLLALILALVPAGLASATASPAAVGAPNLKVSPVSGSVGTPVTIGGQGFQPGAQIDLIWETQEAMVTAEGNMYTGRKISPRTVRLATVRVGGDGSFTYAFKVPEDYGGMRTIIARSGETELTQAGFRIWPRLTASAHTGPVGTQIRLQGDGFGLGRTDSQFHVIYDNRYMGLFSGAATGGKVDLTIPAAGTPGLHRINVYPNFFGPAYLNNHDGFVEYAEVPRWNFDFHLTDEKPVLDQTMATGRFVSNIVPGPVPKLEQGPRLSIVPDRGPIGADVTFSAAGFRPGEKVDLLWQTLVGAYIQTGGFRYDEVIMASGAAGTDGVAKFTLRIPSDVGGWHPVVARGETQTASGLFGVVRAATISPLSGPPGTEVHIKLTGVGWRSWENNTAVTWGNAYTGYACALGPEKGTINVYLTALGEPGHHMIGLWPAIFRGPPSINYGGTEPDNQRLAILTPEDLPEFVEPLQFAFEVTAPAPVAAPATAAAASAAAPAAAGVAEAAKVAGTGFRTASLAGEVTLFTLLGVAAGWLLHGIIRRRSSTGKG